MNYILIDYTYLFLGLIYTTLLPGFVFVEYLLPKLAFWKKIPLYLVLSVIISTYFSYLTALIFGFSRILLLFNILVVFLLFIPKWRSLNISKKVLANYFPNILVSLSVYLLFFVVLASGIFKYYEGYFVMSGPNWQDTAMHLSIIESLTEGNFPPIAPYFSGEKLSYYYFSDFHSAIVNKLYGSFFPWILVFLNSYFAMAFYIGVYTLTFSLTKSKIASILSGIGSLFYGSLGFVNLFKDIFDKKESYLNLLTNNGYHLNFDQGIQMVPMVDYFLQNRPMMVGLPTLVMIVFLFVESVKSKNSLRLLFLAGILNASLVKFQFFGLVIGGFFFLGYLIYLYLIKHTAIRDVVRSIFVFVIPNLVLVLISSFGKAGSRTVYQVVLDSFSFGPWQDGNIQWFLNFIVLNFNVPIFTLLLATLILIYRFKKHSHVLLLLCLPLFFIFIIPFCINFTIYNYDMFKFFYYFVPFIYVVISYYLFVVIKRKKLKSTLIVLFFITILSFSSLTSVNMMVHAYLNRSQGYSIGQYNVGIWIRNNTPRKAIFITSPTVHSPVSDIAGRLRILSYINWPHSHGFNTGEDNVFSRDFDVREFFNDPSNQSNSTMILNKYNIQYIYLGDEERSDFPNAQNKLESNSSVKKIYDKDNIQIFERIK